MSLGGNQLAEQSRSLGVKMWPSDQESLGSKQLAERSGSLGGKEVGRASMKSWLEAPATHARRTQVSLEANCLTGIVNQALQFIVGTQFSWIDGS
jgi:hypothetical protein